MLSCDISGTPPVGLDSLFPQTLQPPKPLNISPRTGGALLAGPDENFNRASNYETWKIYVDSVPTIPSPFTRFKTTLRDVYIAARERASIQSFQAKAEVILFNAKQELMEGSMTSVFLWRKGRWTTPSLASGGQAGTTRRWLLEQEMCAEAVVRVDSLIDGEHCFVSNGVKGIVWGQISIGDRSKDTGLSSGTGKEISGTMTPPGRRSVQFARPAVNIEQQEQSYLSHALGSSDLDDQGEASNKERKTSVSLLDKLKSLVPSGTMPLHTRTQSGFTVGGSSLGGDETPGIPLSPEVERDERRFQDVLREGDDADAEESGVDDKIPKANRKRSKRTRTSPEDRVRKPATPNTPANRSVHAQSRMADYSPTENFRPFFPRRRATMTDVDQGAAGVSEGEGRDRLGKESPWRRGSHWVHSARGQSYAGTLENGDRIGSEQKRPSNLRRFTGFAASHDGADGSPSGLWKLRNERASTLSAAKWRSVKASFKLIGRQKKEENRIDNAKSAELLAELTAGTPAALILASMFQRDEHGNKRIPILLEQLKLRVTDSRKVHGKSSSERHVVFRIELEYGSGLTRMKWVIHRSLRDFANLHIRYKLQSGSEKYKQLYARSDEQRQKLPRFPKSAFPYLRGVRGLGSDDDEEDDEEDTAATGGEDTASGPEGSAKKKRRISSFHHSRRQSSVGLSTLDVAGANDGGDGPHSTAVMSGAARREQYPERQRKKLELYMQQMLRHLAFRADSNRLCKFLELSALGVRLAAEGSYHGKEGFMVIQSVKGLDFRRSWQPSQVASRHSPKWFLVRHSYIVCVDSPEEMNIYDVFLVDSDFTLQPKKRRLRETVRDKKPKDLAISATTSATHPKHHSLKIINSERRLKLLAKNERQLHQFEDSIKFMAAQTPWAKKNRFDSFAPVRQNVFAQWLVDGRDYMWNVSRAISMARDVIYIHDWWLSPELYMRRPPAISQKWRLDRLLQRKAEEGVKVFIIVYRNIQSAIPIDSTYTKFSLLDLHPNIFVQRSPNQARQGAFFWAHHEKICVVDHTVAFVGGIDLCFGRWDTPQHSVVDDKLTGYEALDMPKDADHCQLWPGKDYSNPRVQDFYDLDKPYEEMYDRTKVPRMPWHDVAMQVVGQPARDLTRHFVQRWNYVLRQRRPTRPTPFLLPPADFNHADLEALGLDGTCEVQMLRSCSNWSIGTPEKTEHSIMNAYIKMIEKSEHFVYIENQFFITSCEVSGSRIENLIGDALVDRIIKAAANEEDWRAVVIIPLIPGFQNTVDEQEGTSVRIIMNCQYQSICRGDSSIFGRLKAQGIEPEDYIQFYSLRTWGRIGPNKTIVTEQLYIHAKCMIVDDRIAIIGSANINERSMLGSRDSECAAIVRDTNMLEITMNGEPYLVGQFPHTLRIRLMREHLGLDVDDIMENEREDGVDRPSGEWEQDMNRIYDGDVDATGSSGIDKEVEQKLVQSQHQAQDDTINKSENMFSFSHDVDWEQVENSNLISHRTLTSDKRVVGNTRHQQDVKGEGPDLMIEAERGGLSGGRDSVLVSGPREVLVSNAVHEGNGTVTSLKDQSNEHLRSSQAASDAVEAVTPPLPEQSGQLTSHSELPHLSQLPALPSTDDADIGGPGIQDTFSKQISGALGQMLAEMRQPAIDKDCMKDPLGDSFYLDVWQTVAENNTKLYRNVFRCMPDNEVRGWDEYKEFVAYSDRFARAQGLEIAQPTRQVQPAKSGPPGQGNFADSMALFNSVSEVVSNLEKKVGAAGDMLSEKTRSNEESDSKQKYNPKPDSGSKEAHDRQYVRGSQRDSLNINASADNKNLHPISASDEGLENILHPQASENTMQDDLQRKPSPSTAQKRRRRATTRSSKREFHANDEVIDMKDAEDILGLVRGHLVVWPYDWFVHRYSHILEAVRADLNSFRLAREEQSDNWLYAVDQIAPLEI